MRTETCLACKVPGISDPLLFIAEALSPRHHHHHVMTCESCGRGWYEDVARGAFGQPVPSRRDTVLCSCPEDGADRYTPSVMLVSRPESQCRCGQRELAQRTRAGRRRH